MARSEEKRRVCLNIISHLLKPVPYEDLTRQEPVKLPKRSRIGRYKAVPYPFKMLGERY